MPYGMLKQVRHDGKKCNIMKIVATQYLTRQSPRKVRLVVDQVKDLPLPAMIEQLSLIERHSCEVILKVLRQALANAQHNHGLTVQELKVSSMTVMEGPRYRRFQPVSRGRAHGIIKRTCHVQVVLESLAPGSEVPTVDLKKTDSKSKQGAFIDQKKSTTDKKGQKIDSKKSVESIVVESTSNIIEPTPELEAKEIQKSMAQQPQHLVVPQVQPKRMRQRRTGT